MSEGTKNPVSCETLNATVLASLALTQTERDLLAALCAEDAAPKRVTLLLAALYPARQDVDANLLHFHICNLRSKLVSLGLHVVHQPGGFYVLTDKSPAVALKPDEPARRRSSRAASAAARKGHASRVRMQMARRAAEGGSR